MAESISGIKHPVFRDAIALTRQGGRETLHRYLVEDADQVRQALRSPSKVHSVFTTPEAAGDMAELCAECRVPLYILGGGMITKLLGTAYATATKAVAIVEQRTSTVESLLASTPVAFFLAAERIQDPRNVGVLIRSAESAGCTALLLSADSAEPFSRQAVRSTTGSILRLPLCIVADLPKTLSALRESHSLAIVATSVRAEQLAYDVDLSVRPIVLAVGNETDGISAGLRAAATDFVRLPMASAGASSLNVTVAAGVFLYEAVRQAR